MNVINYSVKKILTILFISLTYSNISYSTEFKNKVFGLTTPDQIIHCIHSKTEKKNTWGFNNIDDEIIGKFTLVYRFSGKRWTTVEAIIFRDKPGAMSWNNLVSSSTGWSIGWFALSETNIKEKKMFKMISEIYFLDDRDNEFKIDSKQRVSKLREFLSTKKPSEVDDIDTREYLIRVLGLVKKIREQEAKMLKDKSYKKTKEEYFCKPQA